MEQPKQVIEVIPPDFGSSIPRRKCGRADCDRCRRNFGHVHVVAPSFEEWDTTVTLDEDGNPVGFDMHLADGHIGDGQAHPMLSRRRMQAFPLGKAVEFARLQLWDHMRAHVWLTAPWKTAWIDAQELAGRKTGRRARPDAYYAALGAAITESGLTRAQLGKEFGLTPGEIRSGLAIARERELLTSPGKGNTNARLTDKGRRALAEVAS